MSLPLRWRSLLSLVVLMALWGTAYRFVSLDHLMLRYDAVRAVADSSPVLTMAGYFMAYAGLVAAGLPFAFLMTWVGAALFGAAIGGSIAILAATTGATLLFLLARSLLKAHFRHQLGPRLSRLRGEFHADAASYLLLVRFAPISPFVVINLAAALLGARLSTYIWTTFIGIIPATFAYAMIGAGLDHVFRAEGQRLGQCRQSGASTCHASLDVTAFISPQIILGLAGLATVMLISILMRRWMLRSRGPAKMKTHEG